MTPAELRAQLREPDVTTDFDCQACGACCSKLAVDVDPFDEVPVHLTKDDRIVGPIMRERKGQCICLKGQIGVKVRCSIYENRPTVCRVFRPGNNMCLTVRSERGIK